MSTGDIDDIANRIRVVLPSRWFPTSPPGGPSATPVLDAILYTLAWPWFWLYQLLVYANLQSRIATATDQFLDIIGLDFLSDRISRPRGQSDARFRARIQAEILRERVTRGGVQKAVFDLTGRRPLIFEPARTTDTGGYYGPGGSTLAYGGGNGAYGSLAVPYQMFVTAFRPHTGGVPTVAGYGVPIGGYGIGALEYATLQLVQDAVTDEEIFETIASTMAAGTIAWTRVLP